MATYFRNIQKGVKTTLKGMSITFRHLWNARKSRKNHTIKESGYFDENVGIVTLQYPHVEMPVPDNGRYQLDCEIDDCIVCDKCAKVCPVDCIEIEAIKSPEIIDYTSDGSPIRLYAAKFDIDMAKCCFCGLCTTVCPTECLTMTNEYDFSVVDITQMNFQFSNLSPEQADTKRKLYEQFVAEKEAQKAESKSVKVEPETKPTSKPAFKPSFKPKNGTVEEKINVDDTSEPEVKEVINTKPAFKPVFKPKMQSTVPETTENVAETPPKPVFKPSFKAKSAETDVQKEEPKATDEAKPKAVFKPSFKPKVIKEENLEVTNNIEEKQIEELPKSKPAFKPTFKPKGVEKKVEIREVSEPINTENNQAGGSIESNQPKSKPVFKPTFKPKPLQKSEDNI